VDAEYHPQMGEEERESLYQGWLDAVRRTLTRETRRF